MMKNLISILMAMTFFSALTFTNTAFSQTGMKTTSTDEPTLLRRAGDYSARHDVMAIAVYRGVKDREQYDEFIKVVGDKLSEKGVPHKFFQKYNDRPGTVFIYFIENDLNGSFDVEEFAAILPHAVRRYKEQYPNL